MKKTHWLLIFIGGIILWAGMILCCLIVLQFGSESFSREELISSSEESYQFDPYNVHEPENGNSFFIQVPYSEGFPTPIFTTLTWKQEDYFWTLDLFMKYILHEDRISWEVVDVSSVRLCSDPDGLPNLTIKMQKRVLSAQENYRIEILVNILPQSGMIEILKREYAPDEGGERTIRWDDIKIPAEQALLIADENGGSVVHQALNAQCRIVIGLKAGIQGNDWRIRYEPINQPSVFEIAVDERTGKYRILREFEK
jgi:hypothetical protein